MKNKYRPLLSLIPLLPLVMAVNYNAAEVESEYYTDFEVSYRREEHYYNYYFYHFNVRNTGTCFISSIYIRNEENDTPFSASLETYDIKPPFTNALIEPGFDEEVIVATKSQIPESQKVHAEVYTFYYPVEEFEVSGTKVVKPKYGNDYDEYSSSCNYSVDASISGLDTEYSYSAAIKLTYEGKTFYIMSYETDNISFNTSQALDLDKLTVEDIIPIQSNYRNRYYNDFGGFGQAIAAVLIFFLVAFLVLSFGIFAAIFFPAMARKRRRRALENQNQ